MALGDGIRRNWLEGLLREVDPLPSLYYWDWTTDPDIRRRGAAPFTTSFMGQAHGNAGPPLQNFESTEGAATASSGETLALLP
jgi:hypothetical protein